MIQYIEILISVSSRLQNIWWQKCVFHRVINSDIADNQIAKNEYTILVVGNWTFSSAEEMNSSIHAYTYGGSFLLYFWESTTQKKLVMMSLLSSCHNLDLLNKEYIFFRECWNSLPYSCDCLGSQAFRMRLLVLKSYTCMDLNSTPIYRKYMYLL